MRLYLLRHARAIAVDGDFFRASLPPDAVDATTTLAISGVIPGPDLLISSPFRRARETAAVFADLHAVEIEIDDSFAEWRLRTLNLEDPRYSEEEERGFRNPSVPVAGGESLEEMAQRVLGGIERILVRPASTVLVVCHGTVIHLVCARIAGRSPTVGALRSTAFLDYAVLESNDGVLRILKDIVRGAGEEA